MRASELGPKHPGRQQKSELLTDCLVDCDPAAASRAGHNRRQALGVSAIAQAVAVGALLLVPLFATGSKLKYETPHIMPPYGPRTQDPAPTPERHPRTDRDRGPQIPRDATQIHAPTQIPHKIDESGSGEEIFPTSSQNEKRDGGAGITNYEGPCVPGGIDLRAGPRPPVGPDTSASIPRGPVQVSQLTQLAMLIHKVEPTYPPLAKLTHKEGTVQLHAIISRDGRVVNLEVLSGDMLLVQSARDAVVQWRFRPTVLNGQPVEVETYITVVFRLGQ
jgi:protein TonB